MLSGSCPGNESFPAQLLFQLHAGDACLNTSPQILFLDPFDPIHPFHIYRDNHSRLGFGKLKGAAHTGSASKRHQTHIVLLGQLNDSFRILLRFTVKDHVHCLIQLRIEHFVDLLRGGLSMAVQKPLFIVKGVLICSKMLFHRLAKGPGSCGEQSPVSAGSPASGHSGRA